MPVEDSEDLDGRGARQEIDIDSEDLEDRGARRETDIDSVGPQSAASAGPWAGGSRKKLS